MVEVSIRNLTKSYGKLNVVDRLDLDIGDKEFLVLVGPSGCGKSTTLRMIAGLEEISSGEIYIDQQVVNLLPPWKRDIAMVFQSYALYPHMSVRENMAFGLKLQRRSADEIERRVSEAARILNLESLLGRRPKELSGGQRQRVAMGRALVRTPKVFLFDEPLSNLDAQLRMHMRAEIKRMHQAVRTTTVYVTHDQSEAMTLADRVVVMNRGRIEQIGTPHDIYHSPATRFVAGFIGSPGMNFLAGMLSKSSTGAEFIIEGQRPIVIPASRLERYLPLAGRPAVLGIRPEHILPGREEILARLSTAEMELPVDLVETMGMESLVYSSIHGDPLIARMPSDCDAVQGQVMRVAFELDHMHLIDPASGKVL